MPNARGQLIWSTFKAEFCRTFNHMRLHFSKEADLEVAAKQGSSLNFGTEPQLHTYNTKKKELVLLYPP